MQTEEGSIRTMQAANLDRATTDAKGAHGPPHATTQHRNHPNQQDNRCERSARPNKTQPLNIPITLISSVGFWSSSCAQQSPVVFKSHSKPSAENNSPHPIDHHNSFVQGRGRGGWREEGGGGSDNSFVQRGREGGGESDMTKDLYRGWGWVGWDQTTAVCVGWGGGGGVRKQLGVGVGGGIRCDNSFVQGWVHPTQDIKGDTLHENAPLSQLGFQTLPSLSSQSHTSMGSP